MQGALSAIAETINPFIDILMAAGLVSAMLSLLTIIGVLSADSSTYIIFDAIRSGVFTFLPVFVAVGYAKRESISPYLAMAMAFALVVPTIDGVEGLTLFGIPLQTITYTNTFIPSLLGAWVLCRVVKLLNKIIPKGVQYFLIPGLSLSITLPIILFLFGPIGNLISAGMNAVFSFLFSISNTLAIVCYAAIHPFMMITGAGSFTVPIVLNFLAEYGYDPALLPGGFIADLGICGAVFGYFVRARRDLKTDKNEQKKKEADLFATTSFSALMGITEPALYGVFAKYRRPFLATLAGACSGALIAGIFGVKTYGYVWGLMSIPTYLTGGTGNFVWILVAIITSFTVSAIVAYAISFPKQKEVPSAPEKEQKTVSSALRKISLCRITDGTIMPLSSIHDQAFASGALGKGIAIMPQSNHAKIFAPADGEVTVVFPTKHAYGIKTDEGIEILIHIGMDTVNLDGMGFESMVKQGQRIRRGEIFAKCDVTVVKEKGFDPAIVMVVTNSNDYLDVIPAGNDDELLYVILG